MHQNWFDQTSMKSKSTSIQSVSDRYWSNIKIASAAQSNHAPMFLNRMMNELFCFGLHFCLLRGIYGWSRHWWDYGFMCNSRCLAEQKYWLFSLLSASFFFFFVPQYEHTTISSIDSIESFGLFRLVFWILINQKIRIAMMIRNKIFPIRIIHFKILTVLNLLDYSLKYNNLRYR